MEEQIISERKKKKDGIHNFNVGLEKAERSVINGFKHILPITFKKLFILSIIVNLVLGAYLALDKNVFEKMMKKEYLNYGLNYCWRATGVVFDKYFQNNIPNKVMSDGYWKIRLWFNEETKDIYDIETMENWEKNSDKVKLLTNVISMNIIEKIKLTFKPISPLNHYSITSFYGFRNMNKWDKDYHSGIDMSTEYGTSVFAIDEGKVLLSSYYNNYGMCVIIQHPYNIASIYGHLSKRFVKKGDMVSKGEIIALVGSTGHSTGPHLHFELRHNENQNNIDERNIETINPLLFLTV